MTQDQWIWLGVSTVLGWALYVIFKIWRSAPCPDGRCYLCRRGKCGEGQACPKCKTVQPSLIPEPSPSGTTLVFETWTPPVKIYEGIDIAPARAILHEQIDRITGIMIRNEYEIDIYIEGEEGGHIVWTGLVKALAETWWRPR